MCRSDTYLQTPIFTIVPDTYFKSGTGEFYFKVHPVKNKMNQQG